MKPVVSPSLLPFLVVNSATIPSTHVNSLGFLSGRLSRQETAWPNPELSIGRHIGKLGKETCWEAKGPARDAFASLAPQIKEYLEQALEPVSSWVTWSLYLVGKRPERASPMVLFCCEKAAHRKEVRRIIKESGILNACPGIKTGHAPQAPGLDQLVQLADDSDVDPPSAWCITASPRRGSSPCGMQLSIDSTSGHQTLCRQATVGGVIQLGDLFYYTTAAHAFQLQRPFSCTSPESSVGDEEIEMDSDCGSDDSNLSLTDTVPSHLGPDCDLSTSIHVKPIEISTRSSSPSQRLMSSHDDESDGAEAFDKTEAICQGDAERPFEELPSIFPSLVLGDVYLSSYDEPSSEHLDYGLIEVSRAAHKVPNSIQISSYQEQKTLCIQRICTDGPKDARILGIMPRGTLTGCLSGTSIYSRLPYAAKFQEVYYVVLDSRIQKGDCGSWVIDSESGDLFGHVVAGSPDAGAALVVPAAPIFQDIARRVQLQPRLPGTEHLFERQTCISPNQVASAATEELPDDTRWIRQLMMRFEDILRTRRMEAIRDLRKNPPSYDQPGSASGAKLPDNSRAPKSRLPHGLGRSLPLVPESPLPTDRSSQKFQNLLMALSLIPLEYENPALLDEAARLLPYERLFSEAEEEDQLQKALAFSFGDGRKPEWGYDDCLIRALLRYFKTSFFAWVDKPLCSACGSKTQVFGNVSPTPVEAVDGALRVEYYLCLACRRHELFPLYGNELFYGNVWKLLKTRRGRVGEWSNCFALLCRALGARVRWVWCSEDRTWVEVYSDHQKRWVHVDPCEEAYDHPSLYSQGLDMGISYVIAFSADGATDVTRRYIHRNEYGRARDCCPEPVLLHILNEITGLRQANLDAATQKRLKLEALREQQELQESVVAVIIADFLKSLADPASQREAGARRARAQVLQPDLTEAERRSITDIGRSLAEEGQEGPAR
ncbi:hypothetical protein XA68_11138 [Ophiocordyceps unilateralis]|uniref:Transglutaminase-like domain-containing protein n=1 Tax=Ophiocordyceps unilateralis TaxID=268505 RepID=A0A2A9PHG4_OPHUN|nr:hypothetical protein XA68_11138 [Ophiocordyceps unilateralis]